MPIFERPPLETLAMARDRWTPIYLEHGRLEVDDASVKWISAEGLGVLIISTDNNCQGFKIEIHGETHRRDTELSGLWLVAEQWVEPENQPF